MSKKRVSITRNILIEAADKMAWLAEIGYGKDGTAVIERALSEAFDHTVRELAVIEIVEGRARLSLFAGGKTIPALNWEELESEAIQAVTDQGGSLAVSTPLYRVPAALAAKGRWQ